MPKKRTFYSEEERKAHHEKKQREANLRFGAHKALGKRSQGHRRIPRIQHSVLQIFFTKHNADLPAAS